MSRRYDVHLPVHYRVSLRGLTSIAGTGTTREMSSSSLSFRCRRPLPVGGHIEVAIDWPARAEEMTPMELVVTGVIIRSDGGRTAVQIASTRFRSNATVPFRATA